MRQSLRTSPIATLTVLVFALSSCVDSPSAARASRESSPATGAALRPKLEPQPAPQAGSTQASCPTTEPPEQPFIPPEPYPPELPQIYGDVFWYGTDKLWTSLHRDGTLPMVSDQHDGSPRYFDKSFWWREGYVPADESVPELTLTGKRLDSPAPAVTVADATNGSHETLGAFMLTMLELPTNGCWEITGHYGATKLSFVAWVTVP